MQCCNKCFIRCVDSMVGVIPLLRHRLIAVRSFDEPKSSGKTFPQPGDFVVSSSLTGIPHQPRLSRMACMTSAGSTPPTNSTEPRREGKMNLNLP